MKRLPEVVDEERDRQHAAILERVTREAEAHWNETAPCGALPVKPFTLADGVELLLYDLRRYQAAVARIFEKQREQKALLDHKTATGQEAEADRQRWLAYLEMTHAITAALSMKPSNEETMRDG
jgi:hypothetical protein